MFIVKNKLDHKSIERNKSFEILSHRHFNLCICGCFPIQNRKHFVSCFSLLGTEHFPNVTDFFNVLFYGGVF